MRRALVTGATGLIGLHVAERLLADGWAVRALVRSPDRAAWLAARGVALATGDVRDAMAVRAAAAECDAIVHAAALVTANGSWDEFRAVNIDGTRHVVGAAAACGARLVHVSSVAVYGGDARYRDRPTDEDTPLAPLPERAVYARSKRESEHVVLDAHARGELWAATVRPCVVYGPHDRQFVPRCARVMRRGIFPLLGRGRATLAIVHAANVADGVVRALGSEHAGGRAYNLTNDGPVSLREFVALGARGLGRRVRAIPLPLPIARTAFALARGALVLRGDEALAEHARGTLQFLTRDNPFSSARAQRELGWAPPVAPDDGIPEAFRWWRLTTAR